MANPLAHRTKRPRQTVEPFSTMQPVPAINHTLAPVPVFAAQTQRPRFQELQPQHALTRNTYAFNPALKATSHPNTHMGYAPNFGQRLNVLA